MQKKWSPKNIVLLVLVLSVWTYMGMRAFDYFGDEEQVEDSSSTQEILSSDQNAPRKKAYVLMEEAYRDPFLGRVSKTKQRKYTSHAVTHNTKNDQANRKHTNGNTKKDQTEPQEIPWPQLVFKGTIENAKNKQAVAVLVINGIEDFYSAGQSSQGVKVLSFSETAITVVFNGEEKVLGK